MKKNQIQTYLLALERQLWLRDLASAETLAEVESHLLEAVEAGLRQGLSVEEAEGQALERFGSVKVVVKIFEKERINAMQKILLAVAVVTGLFITYVDASPNWDDTGIIVGGLLLTAGLLALLGYNKPWLLALAIGLWLPLRYIFLMPAHDFKMLVVLLFPLVGAYAGWAVRLGIRKTFHTA